MKLKGTAFLLIFLFIGVSLPPRGLTSSTMNTSAIIPLEFNNGKILYVGGSGPGNYTRIQEAIDNSSSGDTIYVYSGIYNETFQYANKCCVKIPRSLNLIGENKTTTIINGNERYDTISVTANNVNISGFTIQRGGIPGTNAYGRGLSMQQVSKVMVSEVIFTNNYIGIFLNLNDDILLKNLTFTNKSGGISFWDGKNCTITHCIFDNSGIGVRGFSPSRKGSLYIYNNLFTNNSSIGLGYLCIDSHGNVTIESNLFTDNSCCISTYICKGVNIVRNNFIKNTKNVKLVKESSILLTPSYIDFKQNWINNYWDDWKQYLPYYTIRGTWTIYIGIFSLPIFKFFIKEYDMNPAKEPFDIHIPYR